MLRRRMLLQSMLPRDRDVAARTLFLLAAVAAVMTATLNVLHPTVGPQAQLVAGLVSGLVCVAVAVAGWSFRFIAGSACWAAFPPACVAAIVTLDLLSGDASLGGQLFFFFPVLYAASQLPLRGASLVAVLVVIGSAVVLFDELPARQAVISAVPLDLTLLAATAVLGYSAERQAALASTFRALAEIDPLTGLATRRVLDDAMRRALAVEVSAGTAMILVDIDEFKTINDRWGHPGGDAVLHQLAELLRQHSRAGDTIGRLGGDELALLLTSCTRESASRRADELVRAVAHTTFTTSEGTIPVSVSAGVAHAPTHAFDTRSLYAAADAGLYAAKRDGRNRACEPSAEMVALVRRSAA
jgi:diguanylate cyclase (GGDEF)-like protein